MICLLHVFNWHHVLSARCNQIHDCALYPKVEKVIGRKEVGGKVKYLIHWQGYSTSHDTWEPEENLKNCKDLIDELM